MQKLLLAFLTLFLCIGVNAQSHIVQGQVTDSEGPIPEASVLIKGTKNGTITDLNGCYYIVCKPGDVLVFQYIGYITKMEHVNGRHIVNVVLEEDASYNDLFNEEDNFYLKTRFCYVSD